MSRKITIADIPMLDAAIERNHLWYVAYNSDLDGCHAQICSVQENPSSSTGFGYAVGRDDIAELGEPGWDHPNINDYVICDVDPTPYLGMRKFEIMLKRSRESDGLTQSKEK